jgi:hypothetical protein
MPNESVATLKMIIQSLRRQLEEQQELHDQRCQALLEDRLIKEAEHKERVEDLRAQMKSQEKDVEKVNELYQLTTRDYLVQRHESQATETRLREQLAAADVQYARVQSEMQQQSHKSQKDANSMASETQEYISRFREQTFTSQEDLNVVRDQYSAANDLYEKRLRYLEDRLSQYKNKYGTLENRRRLENEGWNRDVRTMQGRIRQLEKVFMKQQQGFANLPEKEQAQAREASEQLRAIQEELRELLARAQA